MKQLRYIFLFIILFWSSNSLFAQSYNLSDLCATEWNVESGMDALNYFYVYWNFDSKMVNITVRSKDGSGEDILCPFDMYLSDTKQDTFDSSKIGKSTKGKYIVAHNTYELFGETYENFNCYEIVKLTSKELIVKEYSNILVLSAKSSE